MFYSCQQFDDNIGAWDTSSVRNMFCMFDSRYGEDSMVFDQDLSSWNVTHVQYFFRFTISGQLEDRLPSFIEPNLHASDSDDDDDAGFSDEDSLYDY